MESLHAIPEREGERRPVGGDGEAYVAAQGEGRIRLAADPSDRQPGESDDGTHRLIFRLGDDLSPPEPLTDRAALAAGIISHTVLDYKKIGQWDAPAGRG